MTLSLPASLALLSASWDRLVVAGFEVHVSVVAGCLYLAVGHLLLVGPARRRFGWAEEGPPGWRVASWMAGVAVIFFALNGPLHALADERLFAAHMVQHILLMLVMPPLLIMGLPPALVGKALESRWVYRLGRLLTHPAVAFAAYNVVLIGWHVPAMYDAALADHGVHIVQHLTFMAAAVMMWWPVVDPVPELRRIPTGPLLMMYIFAFWIPSGILAAFITMSDTVIYPFYTDAPRVLEVLTPLQDQRLGGVIMWVPGMAIFLIAVSVIFFRWTADEIASWKDEWADTDAGLAPGRSGEGRPAGSGARPSPTSNPA